MEYTTIVGKKRGVFSRTCQRMQNAKSDIYLYYKSGFIFIHRHFDGFGWTFQQSKLSENQCHRIVHHEHVLNRIS